MPVTVLRSRNGVLDVADQPQLAALKTRLLAAGGQARVLVHIHGGLVPQAKGEEIAARLSGSGPHAFNCPGDWEQVYIVWRSGAFETIRTNWMDLAHNDRLYNALLKKLLGFVAGKLKLPDGTGRSAGAVSGLSPAEIQRRLNAQGDNPFADVDAAVNAGRPLGRGVETPEQDDDSLVQEFSTALRLDPEFTEVAADIDAAINPPSAGRGGASGVGDAAAGFAILTRLDAQVRQDLDATVSLSVARAVPSALGVLKGLIEHAAKIAVRVIKRYRQGRDHHFQATVVEELARELYGDLLGATIWGMMKQDGADHFAPGGLGVALIEAFNAQPLARLLVTAHSAGTIWAAEMLRAAAAKAGPKADMVFLAPAVRVSQFASALAAGGAMLGRFRSFAMKDEVERADAVLGSGAGWIYPSSLLYLVSGLFENLGANALPDAAILGMQRFQQIDPTVLADAAEVAAAQSVNAFLQGRADSTVYSKVTGPSPGLSSDSTSHGDFDNEPHTLESVATFF